MNVPIEEVLQPLCEVELQSYFDDLPEEATEEASAPYKEILVDSLTNIKSFMSSFGFTVQDFFNQDKKRFTPGEKGKGKSKDVPKGEYMEQFPVAGGNHRKERFHK